MAHMAAMVALLALLAMATSTHGMQRQAVQQQGSLQAFIAASQFTPPRGRAARLFI
jgi:hypothetical protein